VGVSERFGHQEREIGREKELGERARERCRESEKVGGRSSGESGTV
jgi:hypothetical protein